MSVTDQMLTAGLAAVEDWEKASFRSQEEFSAAERATSALAALHKELSNGGLLPSAWAGAQSLPPVRIT